MTGAVPLPLCNLKNATSASKRQLNPISIFLTKMTLCMFFAKGRCRHGDFCSFIHEPGPSTRQHLTPFAHVVPSMEKSKLNSAAVTYRSEEPKQLQPADSSYKKSVIKTRSVVHSLYGRVVPTTRPPRGSIRKFSSGHQQTLVQRFLVDY